MRKTKGTTEGKTKAKAKGKAAPKSMVKRGRSSRNPRGDQSLSFDPPAQDDMSQQTASKHRIHDSINRVMAECDKVDAALIEFWRQEMPPLTINELNAADGGGETTRGWAVVSADPQRPLTEWQARAIVAAMQSPGETVPVGIAAE